MKILKVEETKKINLLKKEDFINDLIRRVKLICMEDKNFTPSKRIEKAIKIEQELTKKNNKLNNILEKAHNFKKTIIEETSKVDSKNLSERIRLLEKLGSEL